MNSKKTHSSDGYQGQENNTTVNEMKNNSSETQEANELFSASLNKEWGFLEQIAQRNMHKAVVKYRKELFEVNSEHRLEFHREILDARLAALREQTQAGLMMVRGQKRKEVAIYMSSQMEELIKELGEKRESLFLKMTQNYDFIKKLDGNEFLIKRYLTSIQKETEMVIGTMEKLAQNFEKSIMEQVTQYRNNETT